MIDFSKIETIYDLESLILDKSLKEFVDLIDKTRRNFDYTSLNLKYYILDLNKSDNTGAKRFLEELVYKNWTVLRHFVKLYFYIKGVKNSKYYYQKHSEIFTNWEKSNLQNSIFAPMYHDDTNESKNATINYYTYFKKLKNAYYLLEDIQSKNVLLGIVKTRLSYDLNYINSIGSNPNYEYSEDFISLDSKATTLVDAGAYDGDSCLKLSNAFPQLNNVFLFEPNQSNSQKIYHNLRNFKGSFVIYNYGLSNINELKEISIEGVSSSVFNIDSKSTSRNIIKLVKLDDIMHDKIDFLKMDIEGSEFNALKGSINTLKKFHPILAINVDHRICDIWQIIDFINELDLKYRFYMRHYLHRHTALYGTILYALR